MNSLKSVRSISIYAAIFIVIIVLSWTKVFNKYELLAYDLRLQLRPQQKVSQEVVLIEIDDQTLKILKQWPLPRDFHASLIDVLSELGAKAIVFDIIFSDPTLEDDLLADSMQKAGNVYLPEVFDLQKHIHSKLYIEKPFFLIAPVTETLKKANPKIGHINVVIDPDGKIRKTLLFIKDNEKLVPQLGLKTACDFLETDCTQIEFKEDKVQLGGKLTIPVINKNEVVVNYPGMWGDSFQHFSYYGILKAYQGWKEQGKDLGFLSYLKNKVCFIGLTATGSVDLRATPLENNYPMLGLQASLFNSIIEKKFIQQVSKTVNAAIVGIIFIICLVLGFKCGPRISLLGSIFVVLIYFFIATISLNQYGVWIDLFLPICIIIFTYLGCISVRWLGEIQKRQILEKEMLIAQEIQAQFLSVKDQNLNSTIETWFVPAVFVAGDLYEVFKIDDNKTGFLLGDVSGKGLAAALLMAQAISSFRIFSRLKSNSKDALECLNKELCGRFPGRFVTAIYCIADKERKEVELASAGQAPLLIYRAKENKVEQFPLPGSVPLGLMEESVYQSFKVSMKEDDVMIICSDGVIEAKDERGKEFGVEGLIKIIESNIGKTPKDILDCIRNEVTKFSKSEAQFDDITLIVFSFKK